MVQDTKMTLAKNLALLMTDSKMFYVNSAVVLLQKIGLTETCNLFL